MGGREGNRGYLVQTVITLLESLADLDWDSVAIEPNAASEKVDVLWVSRSGRKAVQVKSSVNQNGKADAETWASELKASYTSDTYALILVGPCAQSVIDMGGHDGVEIPCPKSLNIEGLLYQAAHLLDRFLLQAELGQTSAHHRELMVGAMITQLSVLSAAGRALTRQDLVALFKQWILASQSESVTIGNARITKQGIQMHGPSRDRNSDDGPLLILSAYARPLSERVESEPRYPSPSWASDSEFTGLPLFYSSTRDGEKISITPVNPYLDAVHSGGPLHTIRTPNAWHGFFHFPTLDVKLVNNTGKTIFFHEAEFRVAASAPDLRPLPAIIGPCGSLYVQFSNLGWGEMLNARLRFALVAIPEQRLDDAPLELPDVLPHTIQLGTIAHSKAFTLLPFCEIEDGVDTYRLADLLNTRWDSDDTTVRLRQEVEFVYESTDSSQDERVVRTSEICRADYEQFLRKAAGRFYRSRPSIAGVLEYDEVTSRGESTHRTVSVFALLDFMRYGYGAGAPPSNKYHVKLDVEGNDYIRRLQISHVLKAGEADRFLIQVAADRSSFHEFTFALRFNNNEVVEAPVNLELFCSPLDARCANNGEFTQT